jgi:hypothetical protein
VDASAQTTRPREGRPWTTRRLIAQHKRAALGVAALIVVMLAAILVPVLGSKGQPAASDSTTCSEWGSANQSQQVAYARLYLTEHGPLSDGDASPAGVITAINNGCAQAYGDDVSDTTTVVQAISGNF